MARSIVFLLSLLFGALFAQAQYITLQGDQFMDEHGEPFYPVMMSFYLDLYYFGRAG